MIIGQHGNGYFSVMLAGRIIPAPSGALIWHESEADALPTPGR